MTKEQIVNRIVKAFDGEVVFTKINDDCIYVEIHSKTFKVRISNLMVEEVENDIFLSCTKEAEFVECKISNELVYGKYRKRG